MAVDRIDVPSRAGRRTAADLDQKMRMIARYVENTPERWLDHVNKLPVNALEFTNYGFATKQKYIEGRLDFRTDEALIVETEIPKVCRYWSIGLSDMMFATLDWVNNQSSLDRGQARLDTDEKLRLVIAHSDPGVPNWLDTVGRSRGEIGVRWYECGASPLPTVRKVPLADIRKYLPVDTPTVTADQRNLILRARRDAAQLRGIW